MLRATSVCMICHLRDEGEDRGHPFPFSGLASVYLSSTWDTEASMFRKYSGLLLLIILEDSGTNSDDGHRAWAACAVKFLSYSECEREGVRGPGGEEPHNGLLPPGS